MGSSNRNIEYQCSNCGAKPGRNNLIAKRVSFATMGTPYRTLQSRTVAWLCEGCVRADPAWKQKKHSQAPGMADTSIADPRVPVAG